MPHAIDMAKAGWQPRGEVEQVSRTLLESTWISPYSDWCGYPTYNHGFYLNTAGNLVDIFERISLSPGGYLCKKFRTAAYPARVAYNLGYCWPSLTNSSACSTGWTQYSPSSKFCYFPYTAGYFTHDEFFRQCHQFGADLLYIENTAEFNWLVTNNFIQGTYDKNKWNGHRFRYGPGSPGPGPLYWSNGVVVSNGQFGFSYCPTDPDDSCNQESYLEFLYAAHCMNDISGWINSYNVNAYYNGVGSCKRPLCGNIIVLYI